VRSRKYSLVHRTFGSARIGACRLELELGLGLGLGLRLGLELGLILELE
jgi:hypothetical protein